MKEEFRKYLDSVGITTNALQHRIKTIHDVLKVICPDEIKDIFVEEYIKEDGTREYVGVSFYTDKYLTDALDFIKKETFSITPIKNKIQFFRITTNNYDFTKATERSRLNVFVTVGGRITVELKASKENCDHLRDIILKYIIPNLRE